MTDKVATGIAGLDHVLTGGLPRGRTYLIQGDPGVGKTTLALQFLLEGVRLQEKGLYITLSETEEEIRDIADSHGWSLDGLSLFELSATEQGLGIDEENTLFDPSDVELHETTRTILSEVERIQPARVVFDSLSELRLLAQSPLRYRRQVLALKHYFAGKGATVLLLDDRTSNPNDLQLQSLAHGVLNMEQHSPEYGGDRRRIRIAKLRGVDFRSGYHEFVIRSGGLRVSPRLIAAEHHADFERASVSSGLPQLDKLLGGGLARGTSTLLLGPAGTGKSSISTQFAIAAAERGERSIILAFDENRGTLLERARSLGMKTEPHFSSGTIRLQQIDPAEVGPGEFAANLQHLVEKEGVKLVIIDSLNGYMNAMRETQFLSLQLHELLSFLAQSGVTTIMVVAQHGILGSMSTPIDLTYLSDTVIMLRFFEARGSILKSIAVVKKRSGAHENTLRELSMSEHGIRVGRPLVDFTGVLTGTPTFTGTTEKLLEDEA